MRFDFPIRTLAIDRTLDATKLNAVANEPEVLPMLLFPGEGAIDLSVLVQDTDNYTLQTAHGGFIGVPMGYGRYECHSMFSPERAALETRDAMRAALEFMFTRTDCMEMVTKVPEGNRPAGILAKMAHFEEQFTAPIWHAPDRRARYFSLTLDHWAQHACGAMAIGEWFHHCLEQAKSASGASAPVHGEDGLHDQMVGAAALMLFHGQMEKAIGFYNRWARWVGYQPMRVISRHPVVLDTGDAVIELRPTEMEVLSCR